MTFNDLLLNIRLLAEQSARRVRELHSGFGIIGQGGEQWDAGRKNHRLPTAEEFFLKVRTGTHHNGWRARRMFHDEESRRLFRFSSQAIRTVRRANPDIC